jgi:hypothetical protein
VNHIENHQRKNPVPYQLKLKFRIVTDREDWAYDLTPDGIKVTVATDASPVPIKRTPFLFSILVVVIGLVAGGWWYSGKAVRVRFR